MSRPAPPEPAATTTTTTPARRRRRPRGTAAWRRTLREFATIVAGVLAALGAQAWWEGRQNRERERDYLRQPLADTRENQARLASAVAIDSVTADATARLVDALTSPAPLPPADSLGGWVVRSLATSEFQPLGGTYGALLGTGELRLIRNDSLRALLVAYGAARENDREMLMALMEMGLGTADLLPRRLPFVRRALSGGASAAGFDFAPLRDDPDLASVLFRLQAANMNRLTRLRGMRRDTDRLCRALIAEPPLRRERSAARTCDSSAAGTP